MTAADRPESWPVHEVEQIWKGEAPFSVRRDIISAPAHPGERFGRLVLEHPGAAVILAVDDRERVLVLHQYRHPAQRRFLELPAGLCDVPGEDPEQVARRELAEEGALEAADWTFLTSAWSSPGITSEVMHFFVARGLSPVGRGDFELRHEEADMETAWVPYAELHAAVVAGTVGDLPVVAAVLMARARGLV